MKAMMSRSWIRAVLCAAIPVLMCVSQVSWGQNEAPRPTPKPEGKSSSGDSGSLSPLAGGQADEAFEQYANLNRLAAAWASMDSVMMTDGALQFAEAERVLLRSHKTMKTSQVFDLAIRVAAENNDKESLGRIAKVLERSGDKDGLARVNLALKTGGTSRAVDPVLNGGDEKSQSIIAQFLREVQSARLAGSKAHLTELSSVLKDLAVSEPQRLALKKAITDANESLGDEAEALPVLERLDMLALTGRPIGAISEPLGGKATIPPFDPSKKPSDAQVEADLTVFMKNAKSEGLTLKMVDDPLGALSSPSRGNEIISRYDGAQGRSSIWQWVNNDGQYWGENCGTAAMATLMTYHKFSTYPSYGKVHPSYPKSGKQTIVKYIELDYLGPDVGIGYAGTSPLRMQSVASKYGLNYTWVTGPAELQKWVANKYPCAVMLDIANDKAGSPSDYNKTWGFHWVVVFAYDSSYYYVTNWSGASCRVARAKLEKGWDKNIVGSLFGINNKAFLVWPK